MLIRFDPFREFDRLTEQLASTATRVPRGFPMDAYRRGERFIVGFDLPGVEPESIDLTVENNVLSVRSERRFEPREGDAVSWPSARTGPTRTRGHVTDRSSSARGGAQAGDRVADDARGLHLRDADALADLSLGEVVFKAQTQY